MRLATVILCHPDQIALEELASVVGQHVLLHLRFHALGNHVQLQVAGHADDGLHDDIVGMAYAQVAHKRLVDLELIERQAREGR